MTAEDLKAAGFSDAEASQYEKLQGAGFSQDEIIKHFDEAKTPAPAPRERKSWGSLPIDIARNLKDAAVGTVKDAGRKVDVVTGGFNEGLANLLGMPVDAINSALSTLGVYDLLKPKGLSDLVTGASATPETPVGGTKWLKENVMPKPAAPPANLTERVLGATAEMAPAVILPAAGAEAFLARKAGAIPDTLKVIKETAPIIAGSGAGSGVARTVAPGSPAADIAGQLVGGLAAATGPAMYQKGKAAYQAVRRGAPTLTETQRAERAGQFLNEAASPSEITDINATNAAAVKKEIPGVNFTIGQETGDPGLIKLERGLEAGTGKAAGVMADRRATNNAAVRAYLKEKFPGDETVDEVIAKLSSDKGDLDATVNRFAAEAEATKSGLTPSLPQQSGAAAREKIEGARIPMKDSMTEKYQALGNPPVQTKKTSDAVKAVESELLPGEESMYPSGAIGKIKKMLKGKGELTEEQAAGLSDEQAAKAATRAEKNAKKGLETAFSRYKKSKMQLTPDIAAEIKASGKKNLYTLFRKDGKGVSWDKIAQELADEGEIAGFDASDKMDATRFVEWLSENPVLGDKGVYGDRYAAALAKSRAVVSDTGERGFQELHSLRKDLGRLSNDLAADYKMAALKRRVDILKSGIDADIEASLGSRNAYQEARDLAAKYYQTYRSSKIGKILQPGNQTNRMRVPDEDVPRMLFNDRNPSAADEFIKAVGKENAGLVMEDHAAHLILNDKTITNQTTGEISAKGLNNWYNRNRVVLEKYGISDRFRSVADAHNLVDDWKLQQDVFNKSVAGKLLNSDPQNAVKRAMEGSAGVSGKNTGEVMRGLMKKVGKDKNALAGLRNGFKDFLISESESTAETIAGDKFFSPAKLEANITRYDPAIRVLYNDKPNQLNALLRVRDAVKIEARTAKSPIGGGSDTAEKLEAQKMLGGVLGALSHVPGLRYVSDLTRLGLKALSTANGVEMNNFLYYAANDPATARALMLAAKQQAPKLVEHRVGQAITRLGAGVYANSRNDEETPATEAAP